MPTVLLDNKPLEDSAAPRTVRDVLNGLSTQLDRGNRLITHIICDGRTLAGDELNGAMSRSVSDFSRIDLHSESRRTLVLSTLRQTASVLGNAQGLRSDIADQLSQSRTAEAMRGLMSFISVCNQAQSSIIQCAGAMNLDIHNLKVNGRPFPSTVTTITNILRDLRDALTDRDHIRVADQFAYEVAPLLDAWQDLIRAMLDEIESRPE